MKTKFRYVPHALLVAYIIVAMWSAYKPIFPTVFVVEFLTSLIPVVVLAVLYKRGIKLSNFAYVLSAVLPIMHVIGAHYTFALVPFDWFNQLFGFERNMYDRVAHATVGFYAFIIVELLIAYRMVRSKWLAYLCALFAIMALAAGYEIFEWWFAVAGDPRAGAEVLGAQGDVWDAQKDMLMDTSGAILALVLYKLWGENKSS